jgi:hypothetical protein
VEVMVVVLLLLVVVLIPRDQCIKDHVGPSLDVPLKNGGQGGHEGCKINRGLCVHLLA